MVYNIDGAEVAYASYTPGEWLKLTHLIDTDSNLMNLLLNDEFVAQLHTTAARSAA